MKVYFSAVVMVIALSACDSGTEAANKSSEVYENTHKCDELAAHPEDPAKWASGVSDDDLVPGPAVKYCTEAVREYPETPRFHFQLGRALLKANKNEGAISALLDAANSDYGPAFKYLADFYLSGFLGEPDEIKAKTYYQLAADGGFEPAERALTSMLEEDENADRVNIPTNPLAAISGKDFAKGEHTGALLRKQQKQLIDKAARMVEDMEHPLGDATSFDPSPFARGAMLSVLYDGDFARLERKPQDMITIYIVKLNDYFASDVNFYSSSCAGIADPDLAPGVMRGAMGALTNSSGGVSKQGVAVLAEMFKNLSQGPGNLMNRMTYIEAEQNAAKKDGVRLAQLYGCASPVFQRLYANMVNYVKGGDPAVASGWPGLRLECSKYASSKGGAPKTSKQVCACIADKFKSVGVSEQEADQLSNNFDLTVNFSAVTVRYQGLKEHLGDCLL